MKYKLRFKLLFITYALLFIWPIELCKADNLSIDLPDKSGLGKPFLVRVLSQYQIDKVLIKWDNKTIQPSIKNDNGKFEAEAILGIGLKLDTGIYPISFEITQNDRTTEISKTIDIVEVTYPHEDIFIAPKKLVKSSKGKSTKTPIEKEKEVILKAINTNSLNRYWNLPFYRPVKGIMLSRFGLHRVFNGETKSRHTGLDFRASEGTPIHCITGGKVILADTFYFPGNFVMIDHGNGLVSFYCHMSHVAVKIGDQVETGQQIGLAGSTGLATGAHLHLSMYANGRVIDPEPFFNDGIERKGVKSAFDSCGKYLITK